MSSVFDLRKRVRRAAQRAGDWAHQTLPALGQWVYAHTRVDGDVAASAEAPSAKVTPGPLPTLIVPPAEGPLDARLEVFLHVLREVTGAHAAFVADDQGLPLATTTGDDDPIAITAALDRALAPIRSATPHGALGNMALELEGAEILQAIWFAAGRDRFVLGLILPEPLGRDAVQQIRTSLSELITPSHPGGPS